MKKQILLLSMSLTLFAEQPEMFYFLNKDTNDINKYPKNIKYNMITIDLEDSTKREIESLRKRNVKVFCYMSAGTWENWREDSKEFPEEAIGSYLDNWPGECWLDIGNKDVMEIMKKRIKLAKQKGCYGVDFDNIDGYTNRTGFYLSYNEQLNFNKNLAKYAHSLGLKTILKNDLSQIDELEPFFDYAVNESCNKYNECYHYNNWLKNKKYVFNIEYIVPEKKDIESKYFKTYLASKDLNGEFYKELFVK